MPSDADAAAAASIAAAIEEHGGALRFDRYVELALYGPGGFYTTGGRAGRRGDFLTSPEVGPLFGTVVTAWLVAECVRLGRPDPFTVVEVGAGPGTLARSIRAAWSVLAEPPASLDYVAVEVSAAQRAMHPDGVRSLDEAPIVDGPGVVLANELLDNMPFRLLVFDGGWREAYVASQGDRFVEVLLPLDTPPAWLPSSAPHGARVPWQNEASAWVTRARRMLTAGAVTVFDYVTPRTAELAAMPWREWLRTYRGHERGVHYLLAPGSQDITAQVALDQLPEPDEARPQAQFLRRWGIDDLVDEGRRVWEAAAAAPTLAALQMRSRVREAEALLDPAGLGGFWQLTWRV